MYHEKQNKWNEEDFFVQSEKQSKSVQKQGL